MLSVSNFYKKQLSRWLSKSIFLHRKCATTMYHNNYSISVTKNASDIINNCSANNSQSNSSKRIRLLLESAGCKGFEIRFIIDDKIEDNDYDVEGIIIDDISYKILDGSTIDYVNRIDKSGFELINIPSSKDNCSCGSSIDIDPQKLKDI